MQRKQQSDLGVGELQVQMEALTTEKAKVGHIIEKQRLNLSEQNDRFNEVQGQFYSLSASISRIEQQISHIGEREQQLKSDLEQSTQALNDLKGHGESDSQSEIETEQAIEMIAPQVFELEEQSLMIEEQSAELIERKQVLDESWDSFAQEASQAKTDSELEQSRCQFIEKNLIRLREQKESIQQNIEQFSGDDLSEDQELAQETVLEFQMLIETHNESVSDSALAVQNSRAAQKDCSSRLRDLDADIQRLQGRQSALQALVENARTQGDCLLYTSPSPRDA